MDVGFEAFRNVMLNVDKTAVGLKSYSQSQLLDLEKGIGIWRRLARLKKA
ncbi:hypothetical protein HpVa100_10500 [Helicobacter pylori]